MANELEQVVLLDKHCIVLPAVVVAVIVAVIVIVIVADEGLAMPSSNVSEKMQLEGLEWKQRQAHDWESQQRSVVWERYAFLGWWSHHHHAKIPARCVFY